MQPINILTSTAAPLAAPNIDTDQIIPKQFLKRIERTGYGDFLFFDWRRIQEGPDAGKPDPDLRPQQARATRARRSSSPSKNFGCGSSREHAAWALNRLRLPRRHRPQLRRHLLLQRRQERHDPRPPHRGRSRNPDPALSTANPAHKITINLEAQTVTDDRRLQRPLRHRPLPQVLPAERPRRHRPHPPPRRRTRRLRIQTPTKNSGSPQNP